ncbi:MAG: glycosyltransferase family 9 protein [Planctomycetes bacterium]|nr:glycosyltransferase family 9 protein [Planctomycetota bacterium]
MPRPAIPMKRLQRADQRLGLVACAPQPLRWLRRRRGAARAPERILCIKFWGLGSLQMLTAAAQHLRRAHPDAELHLLTLAENEAFARGLGVFDAVRTLDVHTGRGPLGWSVLSARIAALVRELRRARFDAVYDFEFFTRFSALVTLLSGASSTHGYAAPNVWRGGFHDHTVPFNRYWHAARNFRALAGGEDGSDVEPGDLAPFQTSEREAGELDHALERAGLSSGRALVVLNPNAGELSLERRWPAANFAALARALVLEDGFAVALVGAPSEAEYVAGIARAAGELPSGALVDVAGKLSIGALAALLARADAVVTNDSGPMHVSAALGTPTVGLFGPETPVMYGPLGVDCVGLWKPPACSPCINVHENKQSTCVHGRPECLVGISVDEVLAETRRALVRRLFTPAQRLPRHRLRVVAGDGRNDERTPTPNIGRGSVAPAEPTPARAGPACPAGVEGERAERARRAWSEARPDGDAAARASAP